MGCHPDEAEPARKGEEGVSRQQHCPPLGAKEEMWRPWSQRGQDCFFEELSCENSTDFDEINL